MRKLFLLVSSACLLGFTGFAFAQGVNTSSSSNSQPRVVKGQVLHSTQMPTMRLEFDKEFKYAGTQSFILQDVAQAEQHFFVEADTTGLVRRIYWVQFEHYLPGNTHTYNFQVRKTKQIGDVEFIADSLARTIKSNEREPVSDGSRAQSFLESKGYNLEGMDVIMQRLVYLIDERKRSHLKIVYIENLAGTGLTAADLAPNGSSSARWGEIKESLLERASKGMKISR